MAKNNKRDYHLPSRDISYAFTVAMLFGQQLELNLKAILYGVNYHGMGEEVDLTEEQLKRFGDVEGFIDKATCGSIIEKLRATNLIKNRNVWAAFGRACDCRNKLAHSFLASQEFDTMTKANEDEIIRRLHEMTVDLYVALLISRAARDQVELEANEIHDRMRKMFQEIEGTDYEDPRRHYVTRPLKKKAAQKS